MSLTCTIVTAQSAICSGERKWTRGGIDIMQRKVVEDCSKDGKSYKMVSRHVVRSLGPQEASCSEG